MIAILVSAIECATVCTRKYIINNERSMVEFYRLKKLKCQVGDLFIMYMYFICFSICLLPLCL